MKGYYKEITIKDLVKGYHEDDEGKVQGYGGKLEIRPAYQREYIHENNPVFKENLIQSIYNQRPINLIYWALNDDGDGYELLDGQQRIITICRYVAKNEFAIKIDDFDMPLTYHNLIGEPEIKKKIDDYKLWIYVCEGSSFEKLKWFETINTGAEKLYPQELRNAICNGPWVTDAKRYFTKRGNQATMCSRYMSGRRERQDHLQEIIIWNIGSKEHDDIYAFMRERKDNQDATPLWEYFKEVAGWIERTFINRESNRLKLMKGQDWGALYNKYKDVSFNPDDLEQEISELILNEEIQKQSGIYPYVLSGDEKHLNLRSFPDAVKQRVYEKQGGICKISGEKLDIKEMEADHITPWSKGGRTIEENCQMVSKEWNRRKGAK